MHREESIKSLIRIYSQLNEAARCSKREPIFKLTSKGLTTTHEIAVATDETGFEKLVKNLYILFYEASGSGRRLPIRLDEGNIIHKIKELRNHFEHDRELGNGVKKKFSEVGDIFEFLIQKKFPLNQQDWANAADVLVQKSVDLLERMMKNLANPNEPNEEIRGARRAIVEFFEHEITIFPEGKKKFRIVRTHGAFSSLSNSVLFLPTFRFATPPEFGNTQSAVYLASDAPWADFEGFKRFFHDIGKKWSEENSYGFQPASKLMPWSICGDGSIVYGSGTENLIDVVGRCYKKTRATVSMILQGTYGDDVPRTFFIVIGSDLKGGSFGFNFLDFYLGNVPIEWDWIESINNSLDELCSTNRKASNYTLNSYFYNVWEGIENISLDCDVIGGIGRSGYDNRDWDTFEGLILSKKKLDMKFVLDKHMSWKSLPHYKPICPKANLDEFVVSVTNHPPDISEIRTGKLVGVSRPRIYLLEFPGRGWDISAINIWGGSIFR